MIICILIIDHFVIAIIAHLAHLKLGYTYNVDATNLTAELLALADGDLGFTVETELDHLCWQAATTHLVRTTMVAGPL